MKCQLAERVVLYAVILITEGAENGKSL